jgi:hypothetical protein
MQPQHGVKNRWTKVTSKQSARQLLTHKPVHPKPPTPTVTKPTDDMETPRFVTTRTQTKNTGIPKDTVLILLMIAQQGGITVGVGCLVLLHWSSQTAHPVSRHRIRKGRILDAKLHRPIAS